MDRFEPVLELLGQPENPLSIAIADHRERMKRAEAKKDAEEKVELSSNAQDSRDDKLTTGGRPSDNQITNEALGNKPATVGPPTFTRISETLGVKVFRGRRSEVHLEILEDMHERSDTLCPDDIEILESM